jgi:G3E family GTPase
MTPIPVTVLTGFLGAGKTTLLNRILTEKHGRKIAVIENEFGEVGVDNQLVIQADEELFEMNNGCICCTVRGDLIRILNRLAQRPERLDAVLIETTGLANPGPVALTFFTDPDVRAAFRLDGIATVVDAKHLGLHLESSDEAHKQVAFADVIVLNKIDLVSPTELTALEVRLRRINPTVQVHRTLNASVPIDQVVGIGGFSLERALRVDAQFLEPEYPFEWGGLYDLASEGAEFVVGEGPDPEMNVVLVEVADSTDEAITAARDLAVLTFSDDTVISLQPGEALAAGLRLQRIVFPTFPAVFPLSVSRPGTYALFTQHHPDEFGAVIRENGLTRASLWSHAFKPDHEHDEAVGSVGLRFEGDLDGDKLNRWLADLLKRKGTDIFRSKGVLSIKGSDQRLVFQGVHMLFDAKFDRSWTADEPRTNTFVFIGRNLDRTALKEGFERCIADKSDAEGGASDTGAAESTKPFSSISAEPPRESDRPAVPASLSSGSLNT